MVPSTAHEGVCVDFCEKLDCIKGQLLYSDMVPSTALKGFLKPVHEIEMTFMPSVDSEHHGHQLMSS